MAVKSPAICALANQPSCSDTGAGDCAPATDVPPIGATPATAATAAAVRLPCKKPRRVSGGTRRLTLSSTAGILLRGRHPAREIEEALGQGRQVALHLRDREDVSVLRLHVAEVDGVAGLGAVEAGLLGDGHAELVAEGLEPGGADTAARRRPRHDDAVTAEEDEVAQEIGPEETARLLLQDDDVVRLRRDLVHDVVAVAVGPRDHGALVGAAVLPGPAPGVPVV